MSFLWPWALFSGLSIVLLIALYRLRRRARPQTVSSLLLWAQQAPRQDSGRRWKKFRSSRLLILELLLLALLAWAAAGPWLTLRSDRRPLVVVLDDSASMGAGGSASPRQQAEQALLDELRSGRHAPVHWVLAGDRPHVVTQALPDDGVPSKWRTSAPRAALAESVALAAELAGDSGSVLVVSDALPQTPVDEGTVQWWAFGNPLDNVAWVSASRRSVGSAEHGAMDRVATDRVATDLVALEVRNFSARAVDVEVTVRTVPGRAGDPPGAGGQSAKDSMELLRRSLTLEPGGGDRLRFEVPAQQTIEARLPDDALPLDNRLRLLPESPSPVTVHLALDDGPLRDLLRRTVKALGSARLSDDPASADVDIRGAYDPESPAPWQIVLVGGETPAVPWVGPFLLETSHPLSEGLALDGVVWSAAEGPTVADLPAASVPVIRAGEVPLLVDHGAVDGRRSLELRWRLGVTNLERTPNWPILWWNLLDGSRRLRPGVRPINGRLGSAVAWRVAPSDVGRVATLRSPGGLSRSLKHVTEGLNALPAGAIEGSALEPGIHELTVGERSFAFAVNALLGEESDLRGRESGRRGAQQPPVGGARSRRSLTPYGVWLALVLWILHGVWSRGAAGRAGGMP